MGGNKESFIVLGRRPPQVSGLRCWAGLGRGRRRTSTRRRRRIVTAVDTVESSRPLFSFAHADISLR